MENPAYHFRMSEPDLTSILNDLAAGTIDAAEAARRIEAAKRAASGSPEHEGHAPDLDVPQDQPVAVVHEGRDIVEPGPGPDDEPHHEEARDAV